MSPRPDHAELQSLTRVLVADGQLDASPLIEVRRCYHDRSSGARNGWILTLFDLYTGDELKVGSDHPMRTLAARRPWRYQTCSDGLAILPAR